MFLVFEFSDFKVFGKHFVDQQEGNVHMEHDFSWSWSNP